MRKLPRNGHIDNFPVTFFVLVILGLTPVFGQTQTSVRFVPKVESLSGSYVVEKIVLGNVKEDITTVRLHYHLFYSIHAADGRLQFTPVITDLESYLNEDSHFDKKTVSRPYVALLEAPFTTDLDFAHFDGENDPGAMVGPLEMFDSSYTANEYTDEESRILATQSIANSANYWFGRIGIVIGYEFPLGREFKRDLFEFYSLGTPDADKSEALGYDFRSLLFRIPTRGMVRKLSENEYLLVFKGELNLGEQLIAVDLRIRTTGGDGISELKKSVSYYTMANAKKKKMDFQTQETWTRETSPAISSKADPPTQ